MIKKEGAGLKDVCSATIFLKKREDIDIYKKIVQEYSLQEIPAVIVIADICRDELLFEIDAIAVVEDAVSIN